jgi:hypothetical protein
MKEGIYLRSPTEFTPKTMQLYHKLQAAICVSLRVLALITILFGSVLGSLMGGGHLPLSGSWADEKAG